MLQVTNGIVTLTVTKGAFNSFYKNKGFRTLTDEEGREESGGVNTYPHPETGLSEDSAHREFGEEDEYADDTEDAEEEDGDEDYDVDLSEIPLGEMSFDQLSEYADQLELDHYGIRSKKELRALIRSHLKK